MVVESLPEREIIGAYWKREYEKYLVSEKYSDASAAIGTCSAYPFIGNIQEAYGLIVDFVSQIPIPEKFESTTTRQKMLDDLDEISLVLYGDISNQLVKEKVSELGLTIKRIRIGVKMIPTLENLPILIKKLRDILIKAGEFATLAGLRITIPVKKGTGIKRLLEEEGFTDLDLGLGEENESSSDI